MLQVHFKPSFIRQVNRLPKALQDELIEKIALFKNSRNHRALRVHKLHGHLKDCYGFSVNFRFRVVFEYTSKTEAVLLAIGDHSMYE